MKYTRALFSSYQDLPSRETILPEPIPLGFYQSPEDIGEGKQPTPATSSCPVNLGKLGGPGVHSPRAQADLRVETN